MTKAELSNLWVMAAADEAAACDVVEHEDKLVTDEVPTVSAGLRLPVRGSPETDDTISATLGAPQCGL